MISRSPGARLIWLLLAFKGEGADRDSTREYQHERLGRSNGETVLIAVSLEFPLQPFITAAKHIQAALKIVFTPMNSLRHGILVKQSETDGMDTNFSNVYDDQTRAEAYATLGFPGTYYLAFRDLPAIISEHVHGTKALDFGCGAGRSTRFVRSLGFDVLGVDVSEPMLAKARERDAHGDYRLVPAGDLSSLVAGGYDLILSAFTFDNIPTIEEKVAHFRELRRLLSADGKIVNLVSSPEIYVNEWTSFSTKGFPGNRTAQCGDKVRIVMLDVKDERPVEDILWTDEGYREVYGRARVRPIKIHKPLGNPGEGYPWVSETRIAPWVIYVLRRAD